MIFLLPVEWPEMPPYERLLTYYFWRILWRHWRPFLGHQAWSWTTLRKRNVFYNVYKRFFYFCHVFYVFDVFYFYLNVFLHLCFPFPVCISKMRARYRPDAERTCLGRLTPPHRTRQNSPVCVVSGVTVWIKSVRFASISIRARLYLCTLSTAATTICSLYQLKTVQKQFP